MNDSPFRPAPRPRHDGWDAKRQLAFLGALSITRSVAQAARAVGMSREGAYRLRARPDGALFAARWDQILLRRFASPTPASTGHEGHASRAASVSTRHVVPVPTS